MVVEKTGYIASDALISDCGRYRYFLLRRWGANETNRCMFVGLNPSTADAYEDDPTIRRCVGFAKAWGFDALYMMNAYAFRATNPKVMKRQSDPVGPYCDENLKAVAAMCKLHVACWGTHIETYRQTELRRMLPRLQHLGLTSGGYPKHPLYLPKTAHLQAWVETGSLELQQTRGAGK